MKRRGERDGEEKRNRRHVLSRFEMAGFVKCCGCRIVTQTSGCRLQGAIDRATINIFHEEKKSGSSYGLSYLYSVLYNNSYIIICVDSMDSVD